MAINKKYSFGDFTGYDFSAVSADEFNDSEIVGSCFFQENDPGAKIFPSGITGVTFRRCNLDNVFIPAGNTVVSDGWEKCTNKKIMVQNDLQDWVVDENNKPVVPLDKNSTQTDPKLIPTEYIRTETMQKSEYVDKFEGQKPLSDTWYVKKPSIVETVERPETVEIKKSKWDEMVLKSDKGYFKTMPVLESTKSVSTKSGSVEMVIIKSTVEYVTVSGEGKLFKAKNKIKA